MMILVLLLLHSGFLQFTFSANHLRYFRFTGRLSWDDALQECEKNSESLITLYDDEDANFVLKYREDTYGNYSPSVWLGLRKDRIHVTTWSNGAVPTSSDFKTPSEVSQGEQRCGAVEEGIWQNYKCSDKRNFMCQKGETYTLMEEKKDWCQALQHCRRHFTDLAIIDNIEEDDQVKNKSQGNSFWIGLLHDQWKWVDQSCSTHRNMQNVSDNCSAISSSYGEVMHGYDCNSGARGLCSKGSVRIKVITDPELTWEEALNYCQTHHSRLLEIDDEEDQHAVEQWLNYIDLPKPAHPGPFWIGTRQSTVFGFWIWNDRIVGWNNWKDGTQPAMDKPFQCGVINKNFTWSNKNCSETLPFLCEEDMMWMKN